MNEDNTLLELNKRWSIYKTKFEAEMNKNSLPFGDLQPGNIYHLPIITSYQTTFNSPQAGFTKDMFVKKENAEKPNLKYASLIGYTMAFRLALSDENYFNKNIRSLIEEIKLTLKMNLKLTPEDPHYGYYIKLGDFEDKLDSAAYQFTIESNVIPMIQLDYFNKELRT